MQPAKFKSQHQLKILIDRLAALGDVIMITPVLRELRKRYPDAEIRVVTNYPDVLKNNPDVDRVVRPDDITQDDYHDVYINLNGAYEHNITSHYVDSYLYRAFGQVDDSLDRTLTLEADQFDIDTILDVKQQLDNNYIVIHMRRFAWENKNVDPAIWDQFCQVLRDKYPDLRIVSVGAQYDLRASGHPNMIDLVDQLSLGEMSQLIAGAKCFVGGDSGPYHVACTTNTPIVALLTHMFPEQILPWRGNNEFGKDVTVVQSQVPCLGCYARQKPPVTGAGLTCENPVQWECNRKFDHEQMISAVEKYL
jgi:ADP-heptose:LPS heptosyltransferase